MTALPPGFVHHAFDEIGSTSDEAKRRAALGEPAGTFITAARQVQGRGRQGRSWISPAGNAYMSLVLRPERPVGEAAQVSFVAALAVADVAREFLPDSAEIRLKWPNDVLVRGRKLAGILLESAPGGGRLAWLVLGVGINVLRKPDTPGLGTALLDEGATGLDVPMVIESYARNLDRWLGLWNAQGFAPIREAWLGRARGLGDTIEARLAADTLRGRFSGLDETGALILDLPSGERRIIPGGEIFFRPAQNPGT